ncbi:DUF2599 domain-containing protein [Pseudomonas sp. VS40]|uniref:DUF2599 domain-containing protein n=1 Tax=unclassified Pseudomonas TaxID=196821 RepID=UPI001BDE7004|nr:MULTISPECIES: DUF2599 domain-containing protein [unclassified Pseudomonas]MBT1259340.1 DUF2599 domain-containing protein [Pseudomonas sp. VS40]MBT1271024.1 DUF2599 domain-containing protein [Pseudomonas sp. VS59]
MAVINFILSEVVMKTIWVAVTLYLGSLFSVGYALGDAAGDMRGQRVADDLREQYMDQRMWCTRYSAPGFTCNGIILRVTIPSTAYKFWAPSPTSVSNGGWSYSYLRKDVKFKRTVRYENNGNILHAPLLTPPGKRVANVLCAFPEDGGTFTRPTQEGCGASTKATADSRVCHEQGILTAEQWITKHNKDGLGNLNQCAFNVRDNANEKATQSFEAFVKASGMDKDTFEIQNELRLATWDPLNPKTLPIKALFYLPGGLADAQYDQSDFLNASGDCLPIVQMTLPQTPAEDATFAYVPSDQKCSPSPVAEYIQSATWVERFDPGSGRNEWSLSITPTQYGKEATTDQTDSVLAELQKKYGADPRWKDNDGGGMRRQLVCHYVIARNKTPWNIEPRRKDVSEQVAEASGCNPPF